MPRNLLISLKEAFEHSKTLCMSSFPRKRKATKLLHLDKFERFVKRGKTKTSCLQVVKPPAFTMDAKVSKDSVGKTEYLHPPLQSENDKKEYRVLQLLNGMRVLLISDPNISESEPKTLPKGVDNMGYSSAEESISDGEIYESDEENQMVEEEDSQESQSEAGDSEPDSDSTETSVAGKSAATRKGAIKEGDRMAAASLSVNVGSFSDPPDLPGLAHFLEHMVFMGSKRYPEENAFDEYLKIHGGGSNASTDCETTTFEFEIHQHYFREALEMFTQFFATPLLLPASMKREKEAIDSEFQMALPSDSCRRQQLIGHLANKNHPMAKFMWGNSSTLRLDNDPEGTELNRRVREFWQEYYTADRMTAVLQSKHTLDQLEEWAASIFRNIPSNGNKPSNPPCFSELGPPFDSPNFRKLIRVVPVKDVIQVSLTWALPSQLMHYRIKPLGYLSWLIGHEGKGSLLAFLRKKVWALDLASGNDESGFEHNSTYASFGVSISLTERGIAEIEHVLHAVFQYIKMLQENGPDERVWKEIKAIEEMSFRYSEDVPPIENVETLSENMHKFQPEDYISGETLFVEFNPKVIADCISALRVDNVNIMISSKEFEKTNLCTDVEPWFQTKYSCSEIPQQWIQLWSQPSLEEPHFAVPEANNYLASDFSIVEVDVSAVPDFPVRIDKPEDDFKLWHRPDTKFRLPKAVLSFYLVSPVICESAQNTVLLELLGKILRHQLMEQVYGALVAQLELTISHFDRGLIIKVNGFNHKLHILVQTVVEQFAKFEEQIEADVFSALREQQEKAYRNYRLKPTKLVNDARLTLLHTTHWSILEKSQAIKLVTLNDMKQFSKQLKETFRLEGLCQGNYTQDQALEVTRLVKIKLQEETPKEALLPPIRICQVPVGMKTCCLASFHPSDANSVVVNYYQVGPTNMHQTAVMEILVNLMEEPVFDVLRTREQLGYNVYVTLRNTFGILGFSITVDFQADKFSASHVDCKIEEFLSQFELRLNAMTDEDLKTRVQSLIKLKQVPDVSLDEEVSRNWNELLNEEYLFERLRLEIEQLPLVTLEELRLFYKHHALSDIGSERRKLSMQVIGTGKKGQDPTEAQSEELRFIYEKDRETDYIRDLNEFRNSSVIFPPVKTFDGLPFGESCNKLS